MTYIDRVKPTYMENWPEEIRQHTIPYELVPVPNETRLAMMQLAWDGKFADEEEGMALLSTLEIDIHEAANRLIGEEEVSRTGFFARLSSRSPKDAWGKKPPYFSGKDAMFAFLESERVFDDFFIQSKEGIQSYVAIRPFVSIQPETEFRCFIKGGQLKGISQYFYQNTYPWIAQNSEAVTEKISELLSKILPYLSFEDVVADFTVTDETCTLIELNPFFEYTDPCLFSWDDGEEMFKGEGVSFRWKDGENEEDEEFVGTPVIGTQTFELVKITDV